uniref:Lipid transfer protein n=1 Tax=Rhizophora mucronata TaxID=61149 RepID=A0A2P2Q8C7_RHIMU
MERSVKGLLAIGLVMYLAVCARPALAITCGEAIFGVLPCQPYLIRRDEAPSSYCCAAVESLNDLAVGDPTTCKYLCSCFKQAVTSLKVDVARAHQLPKLCKADVAVPIDPTIDCNR